MSTSSSESSSSDEYGVTPAPLEHNLSKEVLNLYVERVRISLQAENYGIDENAHKSAHAVIYLLTSDGNSVELNMGSPSARTFIGKMMIRQHMILLVWDVGTGFMTALIIIREMAL
ncbi:uncharacterized protein N7469_009587 [Penicillium citrinum]|uniref:Uncharacterized protein n=1 Tax=Penicillium citrinum TaxID=5077 RepID=A0A9W9TGK5_PENCI|nr:uncharacterized protein N7469_009587 [Penicillium citrinum]KAJ5220700.1 hypothetical protein N7469_009587 [Penicillium citrinum]